MIIVRNKEQFEELWRSYLTKGGKKKADALRRWWNKVRMAEHGYYPKSVKYKYEPDPVRDVEMSTDPVVITNSGDVSVGGIKNV